MSGISMSMITASGFNFLASRIASRPFFAWPTTSNRASAASNASSAARKSVSSSATRILCTATPTCEAILSGLVEDGGRRLGPILAGPGLVDLGLDVQLRQPLEPAREVPVPVAEQLHRRRQQDAADQRRVEQ